MPAGLINRRQGAFGEAVVAAVASAAGLHVARFDSDPGIDLVVKDRDTGETIEIQVKTDSAPTFVDGCLRHELEVEYYDELRAPSTTAKKYLVVLVVPPLQHQWLVSMEWAYLMRHRAWFTSLAGEPETKNAATITVDVPTLLTPASIKSLLVP